ncbi:MAG: undecaprenyl-diphosphate phosphatase [Ruminococcaceae bacterium]|nr:undecaprenyl-diphosphate phosphatase [Oscillospiraceae bacterium]
MSIWEAIFYGIIQGLTEFLPVSSSGHLAMLQNILGFGEEMDAVAFNVLLHLGTLIAVFAVYYKDIFGLVKSFFSLCGKLFHKNFKLSEYTLHEKLVIYIIIGTLPLVPMILIEDYLDMVSSYLVIIGALLIFNGLVLMISDKLSRGNRTLDEIKPKNALLIGLCQAVALLPGISRSGSTITGGLLNGLERPDAVRFSFLLSIPAILGASILKLPDFFAEIPDLGTLGIYIAGAAVSAVVGICAIKLLSYISKKSNFRMFSYYCFAVGAFAVVWSFFA